MTALVWVLLGITELLEAGQWAEAVRTAGSPQELLDATKKLKDVTGVVREVVRLRGPLRDAQEAARWLEKLGEKRNGDPAALNGAGYLLLKTDDVQGAIRVLRKAGRHGLALAYLADAYRRAGDPAGEYQAILAAAEAGGVPPKYLGDLAASLGARMRANRDRRYAHLMDVAGRSLTAALWLAEDIRYERGDTSRLKAQALALFQKGLGAEAPATAYWEAAQIAAGDVRFQYLVQAVQRGADPRDETRHACPGAVLALARECQKRGRIVAAAALAKQRLRIGDCEAAWDLLESLPPALAQG